MIYDHPVGWWRQTIVAMVIVGNLSENFFTNLTRFKTPMLKQLCHTDVTKDLFTQVKFRTKLLVRENISAERSANLNFLLYGKH